MTGHEGQSPVEPVTLITGATRAPIVAISAGRLGRPQEIAGVVAYFISEEACFTTGQPIFVCSGLSIGSPMIM